MIGDGQCFMAEPDGSPNQFVYGSDGIQFAHFGMAMQFHSFNRGLVFPLRHLDHFNGGRRQGHGIMVILIRFGMPHDLEGQAGF